LQMNSSVIFKLIESIYIILKHFMNLSFYHNVWSRYIFIHSW